MRIITYGAPGLLVTTATKEGLCDGAEFLASGWGDGGSRIAEGSYGVGGRPAVNAVLEESWILLAV
jgi:hypothetical protein